MRYWLCARGRVTGPFSPEELGALPDFRSGSLVCPEDRPDRAQTWSRASSVPELRASLPPDYVLSTSGGGRKPGWLPPDPTLDDAAAARSLEAGLRRLEERLTGALDRLRERDAAQAALKKDIRRKEAALSALRRVLSSLAERLQALAGMHDALKLTHDRICAQGETLTDFQERLQGIRRETAAALTAAEDAARRTTAEAQALVSDAREKIDAALRTAAQALDAAAKTEQRAVAAERLARLQAEAAARAEKPARSGKVRKKPPPAADLGFPDATSIDDL